MVDNICLAIIVIAIFWYGVRPVYILSGKRGAWCENCKKWKLAGHVNDKRSLCYPTPPIPWSELK